MSSELTSPNLKLNAVIHIEIRFEWKLSIKHKIQQMVNAEWIKETRAHYYILIIKPNQKKSLANFAETEYNFELIEIVLFAMEISSNMTCYLW